ncbi:hypothetical protein GQR58_020489 [Nymphon striatum]|nr:hypothetical protein GQR58_020489 [Nymphon striatum]
MLVNKLNDTMIRIRVGLLIREMNMAEKSIEIAHDRGLATEDLLKYDVLPSPMLFDDHGLMTKPEKSQLIRELEDKLVSDDYSYHHKPESAFIIDVMATVCRVPLIGRASPEVLISLEHNYFIFQSQLHIKIYHRQVKALNLTSIVHSTMHTTMHVLDRQLNVRTEDLNPVDYGFRLEDGQLLPSTSWKTLEARWFVAVFYKVMLESCKGILIYEEILISVNLIFAKKMVKKRICEDLDLRTRDDILSGPAYLEELS